MIEENKIKEEIKTWIKENRGQLPLNASSWNIQVLKKEKGKNITNLIRLGKYNAEILTSDPFYKPYSKTSTL